MLILQPYDNRAHPLAVANRYIKPEAVRRHVASVRYTEAELVTVKKLATRKKLGLSEYIRERSLEGDTKGEKR